METNVNVTTLEGNILLFKAVRGNEERYFSSDERIQEVADRMYEWMYPSQDIPDAEISVIEKPEKKRHRRTKAEIAAAKVTEKAKTSTEPDEENVPEPENNNETDSEFGLNIDDVDTVIDTSTDETNNEDVKKDDVDDFMDIESVDSDSSNEQPKEDDIGQIVVSFARYKNVTLNELYEKAGRSMIERIQNSSNNEEYKKAAKAFLEQLDEKTDDIEETEPISAPDPVSTSDSDIEELLDDEFNSSNDENDGFFDDFEDF